MTDEPDAPNEVDARDAPSPVGPAPELLPGHVAPPVVHPPARRQRTMPAFLSIVCSVGVGLYAVRRHVRHRRHVRR